MHYSQLWKIKISGHYIEISAENDNKESPPLDRKYKEGRKFSSPEINSADHDEPAKEVGDVNRILNSNEDSDNRILDQDFKAACWCLEDSSSATPSLPSNPQDSTFSEPGPSSVSYTSVDFTFAEPSPSPFSYKSVGEKYSVISKVEGRRGIHSINARENHSFTLRNRYFLAAFIVVIICYLGKNLVASFPNEKIYASKIIELSNKEATKLFIDMTRSEYPSQDLQEFTIFSKQVEYSRNSNVPSFQNNVFILLTHENIKTANEIAKHMAQYVALRFRGSSEIFTLSGSEISMDYFPTNIQLLKEMIIKTGNFLVTSFEKLSPEAAKNFHFICDKYTPFIDTKAVFIFVLNTNDKNFDKMIDIKDLKKCAQRTMASLWSELPIEILDPLIVRLSENIIKIYPEN